MDRRSKYKSQTIKFLEEPKRVNLYDLEFGNRFFDMTLKAWATKKKKVNWTSSKLKTIVHQRTLLGKQKDNPQSEKKVSDEVAFEWSPKRQEVNYRKLWGRTSLENGTAGQNEFMYLRNRRKVHMTGPQWVRVGWSEMKLEKEVQPGHIEP